MGGSIALIVGHLDIMSACPFYLLFYYEVFTMSKSKNAVQTVEGVVVQVVSESAKTAQFSLPVDQVSLIDRALEGFFKADKMVFDASEVNRRSAGLIAEVLGTNPDYAHWVGVRGVTIGRVMAQKATMSEEAAQKYWDRTICGYLDKEFGLTKPKSASAESEKKRKQREEKAKKLQGFTDSQLLEKVKELAMAFEFDKAKELKAEIKRRDDLANAGLKEECKTIRGEIVKRLAGFNNKEVLLDILAMLPEPVMVAQ
jgi:hypothetical protein